ncbi:hypothetical protein SAMN05880590_110131 [Rhizobium sp. RU35A]|uniref:NUDIX hydrolase n=1 Tax=Rhizobium sp. RU35A TaxID=1907414 RepID=UPI000956FDBE|nr:NUDIX hydrolase [Rhizobium sp. RU35A]SIR01449.1 hypothetical protein SAMN05880590_110131 [Rhizobium sp. RU35A]
MFAGQPFSIPVDCVACTSRGRFELAGPVEAARRVAWDAHRAQNASAFDGSLLRLDDLRVDQGRLVLQASRTCYSAYVATRHPEFAVAHPDARRADPLGMTALVVTADDHVIVTRRSLTADQNPGALYLIGGYAEPPEVDGSVDLFQEIAREIAEEIAVTDLVRSASSAIGMGYDPVFCHPELFFVTPSRSSAADILKVARQARDRGEASRILAYPLAAFFSGRSVLADAPETWSFITARSFLLRHLEAKGGIANI